jgi:hypothetical protein
MATVVSFPLRAKVTARRVQRDKSDSLTELRIEKLKATGAEYYVNDGRQPGLSVRVSAQGVKAFVFTKKKDGRLTRITIDRSPAMRLEDARRAAQKLHGEMALGIDVGPSEGPPKPLGSPTRCRTLLTASLRSRTGVKAR